LAVKKIFAIAGVCTLLLAAGAIALAVLFISSSAARRVWKEKAIAGISSQVADPMWPSNEIARLSHPGTSDPQDSDRWLSDSLILTRNGDWLT